MASDDPGSGPRPWDEGARKRRSREDARGPGLDRLAVWPACWGCGVVTEWFLDMIEAVLDALLALLPDWSGDPFETWGMVLDNLGALNYYLPIGEVFAFVMTIILLVPVMFGISFSLWIVALIRGGASRG